LKLLQSRQIPHASRPEKPHLLPLVDDSTWAHSCNAPEPTLTLVNFAPNLHARAVQRARLSEGGSQPERALQRLSEPRVPRMQGKGTRVETTTGVAMCHCRTHANQAWAFSNGAWVHAGRPTMPTGACSSARFASVTGDALASRLEPSAPTRNLPSLIWPASLGVESRYASAALALQTTPASRSLSTRPSRLVMPPPSSWTTLELSCTPTAPTPAASILHPAINPLQYGSFDFPCPMSAIDGTNSSCAAGRCNACFPASLGIPPVVSSRPPPWHSTMHVDCSLSAVSLRVVRVRMYPTEQGCPE
jgi:hypothetical protein